MNTREFYRIFHVYFNGLKLLFNLLISLISEKNGLKNSKHQKNAKEEKCIFLASSTL